jgi:hypothetical protein
MNLFPHAPQVDMSRSEADRILREFGLVEGSYLFRTSRSTTVLSLVHDRKVRAPKENKKKKKKEKKHGNNPKKEERILGLKLVMRISY